MPNTYTQSQREQAARVLEWLIEDYEHLRLPCEPELRIAIACLRSPSASPETDGKAGGWVNTETDKPTDPHETIIVQDENGQVYTAPGWIVRDFPATHPRWMHLPKVSGSEGRKAPGEEIEG